MEDPCLDIQPVEHSLPIPALNCHHLRACALWILQDNCVCTL
jgi:hypothetical protein